MFNNRFFDVLVAVAVLVVMMLTIQEAVATRSIVAEVESASRSSYSVNPELRVAARYNAEGNAPIERNQLAANPELSIVRRYTEIMRSVNTSLAINPELSVANRYADSADRSGESAFLSTNPELSVVRRYAALRAEE